jgi:hypothetical protein
LQSLREQIACSGQTLRFTQKRRGNLAAFSPELVNVLLFPSAFSRRFSIARK